MEEFNEELYKRTVEEEESKSEVEAGSAVTPGSVEQIETPSRGSRLRDLRQRFTSSRPPRNPEVETPRSVRFTLEEESKEPAPDTPSSCLLYTSDAADE